MRSTVVGLQRDARGVPLGMLSNTQKPKITIIAGPPAAGKTTYVQDHKGPTDVVIDLDALAQAIGSENTHGHNKALMKFAWEARDALINKAQQASETSEVWIIRMAPTVEERRNIPGAKVIVLETNPNECKTQARATQRPPAWSQYIDEWWNQYEPDPRDIIVRR